MALDVLNDTVELVERLCGLGIEEDITGEVEALHLVETLNDDGVRLRLSDESKNLGVTFLAEDHDLWSILIPHSAFHIPRQFILLLDALLELEHHRAGGIDNLDVVTTGEFVGLRRFPMGTQQHLHIMELTHIIMVDGDEPQVFQPLTFHTVVNDIAQTVEGLVTGAKLLLSLLNGGGHSETEATAFVYLDLDHSFIF